MRRDRWIAGYDSSRTGLVISDREKYKEVSRVVDITIRALSLMVM